MAKRGPKPKGKVKIRWSADFAYGVGLIASDGNLSPDGRHINFTTKDQELSELFMRAFGIKVHVGRKGSGSNVVKKYYVVQFSDSIFYSFLLQIGLTPHKSKSIGALDIPDTYFFDFLRGSFDGDGSTYSYIDPRWKSSFMYYTVFSSASRSHISWLQSVVQRHLGIKGHVTGNGRTRTAYQLKYAKKESQLLLMTMYPPRRSLFLKRKKLKIDAMLRIIHER